MVYVQRRANRTLPDRHAVTSIAMDQKKLGLPRQYRHRLKTIYLAAKSLGIPTPIDRFHELLLVPIRNVWSERLAFVGRLCRFDQDSVFNDKDKCHEKDNRICVGLCVRSRS